MSMLTTSELAVSLPLRRRLTARCAVGAARLLVLLPPRRIGQVLRTASRGARPATAAEALGARQAVVTVSARCAGQHCLERSIAAALLCRLGGSWPDWCTGVRTQPFRAHAWIEVQGSAIGEAEDTAEYHPTMAVRHRRPKGRAEPVNR